MKRYFYEREYGNRNSDGVSPQIIMIFDRKNSSDEIARCYDIMTAEKIVNARNEKIPA